MSNESIGEVMPDEDVPQLNYLPLRATFDAKGEVGGDSQAFYGFHGVEGQTLTVHLNWRDNKASFGVNFDLEDDSGATLDLGPQIETDSGSSQSGKLPKTGFYYINVLGDLGDTAEFDLHVTLE